MVSILPSPELSLVLHMSVYIVVQVLKNASRRVKQVLMRRLIFDRVGPRILVKRRFKGIAGLPVIVVVDITHVHSFLSYARDFVYHAKNRGANSAHMVLAMGEISSGER